MRLVLERFTHNALALLAVTTILFFMFRLMPGTPLAAFISENLNADQQQAMLEQFGLDRPMWQQYFIYLGNLLQGEPKSAGAGEVNVIDEGQAWHICLSPQIVAGPRRIGPGY